MTVVPSGRWHETRDGRLVYTPKPGRFPVRAGLVEIYLTDDEDEG